MPMKDESKVTNLMMLKRNDLHNKEKEINLLPGVHYTLVSGVKFSDEDYIKITDKNKVGVFDGRKVKIPHDSGINRIDRVTASNFGMEINQNHCRNIFVKCGKREQMLQIPSLYFQCPPWTTQSMQKIMWDVAVTSLEVLSESIPQP